MRQFITADDFNMTVFGGKCAADIDGFERRLWPTFRQIRADTIKAARGRNNG